MREIRLIGSRALILRTVVPDTRSERMRGLLDHFTLAQDEALLLTRARSIHTFGMRFPIRAARLDERLVVRSVRHLPPGRLLLPRPRTRHVLECAEGTDIRPGDRLRIVGTN